IRTSNIIDNESGIVITFTVGNRRTKNSVSENIQHKYIISFLFKEQTEKPRERNVMKRKKTIHHIGEKVKYAKRIVNEAKYDVIKIHMKKKEEIMTQNDKEETLIIVRAGKVLMNVEGESVTLTNETVLQMNPYEEHDLKAIEESDWLLLKIK